MKDNYSDLYGFLEQLPTEELDSMLQGEVQKETIDEDAIRLMLRVLKAREPEETSVVGDHAKEAWEKYWTGSQPVEPKAVVRRKLLFRVATAAAVLCVILFVVPQTVGAEEITGLLTRWTEKVFEFFDPRDTGINPMVYEFKTDHPGLQQVYDAVVEMGVTDPVVPMWVPEGFELVEYKHGGSSRKKALISGFKSENEYLVIQVDMYSGEAPHTYHKDETYVETYELMGVSHTILKNNGRWVAIWRTQNIEVAITAYCQEEEFYRIIESIYMAEVK